MGIFYEIPDDEPMGRYDKEIAIMKYMGWSWFELMQSPSDLVERIAEELLASAKWRKAKNKMSKK